MAYLHRVEVKAKKIKEKIRQTSKKMFTSAGCEWASKWGVPQRIVLLCINIETWSIVFSADFFGGVGVPDKMRHSNTAVNDIQTSVRSWLWFTCVHILPEIFYRNLWEKMKIWRMNDWKYRTVIFYLYLHCIRRQRCRPAHCLVLPSSALLTGSWWVMTSWRKQTYFRIVDLIWRLFLWMCVSFRR